MLVYHSESDALFYDRDFKFEGPDGGLCEDVTDEIWAVERAVEEGIEMAFGTENWLALLIETRDRSRDLPDENDPIWRGL